MEEGACREGYWTGRAGTGALGDGDAKAVSIEAKAPN